MTGETALDLPPAVEACRARLEQDLLDADAARQLREAVSVARLKWRFPGARRSEVLSLGALGEVCTALEGGGWGGAAGNATWTPPRIERALHEAAIIHPAEKQGRHHRLTSLLGRVLHLLQGHEMARIVARVTEKATPQSFPRLFRLTGECARSLEVAPPEIHIARGEEPLFTVLLDRSPFLCVHRQFVDEREGHGAPCPYFAGVDTLRLSDAETRFALAHQLEHIKGGHTALLQIGPELLENLLLDQMPFLVRTPIKLASKALGWTGAGEAVKKAGGLLPKESRSQWVVNRVGELLPGKDQETVLPEAVHEWVRSWIQGVEYSADRAGLLAGGSVLAACSALLRLSSRYRPQSVTIQQRGVRWLLLESADTDRATSDRLRELLRFALSKEYLAAVVEIG